MGLLGYVKALENRDNWSRGQQVIDILAELGIEPTVQEWPFPKIRNIIAEPSAGSEGKRLLFSAHYDAAGGSPGANDNASGVAVLLELCRKLRHIRAPVRVVFFDREEAWLRTPVLHLGLLGSIYYVCKNDLQDTATVYNIELCGLGEFLGVWPVKSSETGLAAVKEVEKAAKRLSLTFGLAHLPWLLHSSDHLPFRLRGIANALTLSLLPVSQVPLLESSLAGLSIPRLLIGRRPALPEPLSSIHTTEDTSSRLDENSLELMLSLLLELIQNYRRSGE